MTEDELNNLKTGDRVYYTGSEPCISRDPIFVSEDAECGFVIHCNEGSHSLWKGNMKDFRLCETGEHDTMPTIEEMEDMEDCDQMTFDEAMTERAERDYAAQQEALRVERRDQAEARFHLVMDGIRDTLRVRRDMHEKLFEAIKDEIKHARNEETVDSLIIVARKFFGEG